VYREHCKGSTEKGMSNLVVVVWKSPTDSFDSYLVAIVSNQGGISLKPDPKTVKSDQKRLADFKAKVSAVLNQLDIPISIYAATARDQYRKPRTGMWHEILEDYDLDEQSSVDLENSLFVGDAGGRDAVAGGVKDHSCVDRLVMHFIMWR
jgi:bifunctional polynucleotide phosphatase/kinase